MTSLPAPRSQRVAGVRRIGGGSGADHQSLPPDYPRPPSPEKNAPRASDDGPEEGAGPAAPEPEEVSAMLGGGGVAGGVRGSWDLPPAPAATPSVAGSRGRAAESWGRGGLD